MRLKASFCQPQSPCAGTTSLVLRDTNPVARAMRSCYSIIWGYGSLTGTDFQGPLLCPWQVEHAGELFGILPR